MGILVFVGQRSSDQDDAETSGTTSDPLMSADPDRFRERLENDRRSLLDLSLRNPLLNYRPRVRGLELVDERPVEVHRILVNEGRAMTFAHDPRKKAKPNSSEPEAVPEPLSDPGEETEQPAPEAPPVEVSHTDSKLQTAVSAEELEERLLKTYHAARTSIEEQGVNTLFLALGMLSWVEKDNSQRTLKAPLLLIPVELERSSARERFRLKHDGNDVTENLSLAEKLRLDFRIALTDRAGDDDLDVNAYFDAVGEAVRGQEGWSIDRDALVLGFFASGKFLMYVDLDMETWPEEASPCGHPVLRALLGDGFQEPKAEVDDEAHLDAILPVEKARQVVDADSSQTLAMLDVAQGRNLVIQGPPGTGKSQTITNLMAEALGRGQRVLFVAEKLAALEVVKRRLDSVGLGDACLELHSHKTRKKAVLDELRRTLALGKPKTSASSDDLRMLGEVRERLNTYCEALNEAIGSTGVTPQQAYGALVRLKPGPDEPPLPRSDLGDVATWTSYDYKRRLALVESVQARLSAIGTLANHPFFGSGRMALLPSERDALRGTLTEARQKLDVVTEAAGRLAERLGLPTPTDRAGLDVLLRSARRVLGGVRFEGADVKSPEWRTRQADVRELIEAGEKLEHLHSEYDAMLLPEAWTQDRDLLEAPQQLNSVGRSWLRFFSGGYHRAKRTVATLCKKAPPRRLDDQIAIMDAVLESRRCRDTIGRHEPMGRSLLGSRWKGERSAWHELGHMATWIQRLQDEARTGRVSADVLDRIASAPTVDGLNVIMRTVRDANLAFETEWKRILSSLEFDEIVRFGPTGSKGQSYSHLSGLLDSWTSRIEELSSLVSLNQAMGRCREEGLSSVSDLAATWPEASTSLVRMFRARWFEGLLEHAMQERPALATTDGTRQNRDIEAFNRLDRLSLKHARDLLAMQHYEALPRHEGGGQLAVLRREFEKKTRHLPVRQLLERAGLAVQAIKPIFMMSPLSVATYLTPGSLPFDLVVFDEASQVRPVDSLGALMRGRQAVVVGDSRQLPPTRFFDRLTAGDDAPDDDLEPSAEVESILGLFVAQGAPQRLLRWHYRSRHQSLIAVSNHEFYEDRLVIFPSPQANRGELGLVFRHLPNTAYDRGKTHTNPGEADVVASAVMAFAREQMAKPEGSRLTLGVAAFSQAQMQAILDRLEPLRRVEPECEAFFRDGAAEPFFVKNLENVQGDERDVIFISVGYGRTAEGSLAMNFGPLNGEGGEHRLNVLITRARMRCEVFTNLLAADIDLSRTQSRGVQAFKTFLAYAASGSLDTPGSGGEAADSPFEESVSDTLAETGHQVVPRVGTAGFRMDLAVVDPDDSARYLIGLECDGANYASARSARDRDRLRPQVLTNLGWNLHRIWSVDWFQNAQAEQRHLAEVLAAARGQAEKPVPPPPSPGPVDRDPASESPTRDSVAEPILEDAWGLPAYTFSTLSIDLNGRDFHEVEPKTVVKWVTKVVRDEGPVARSEVLRRVLDAAGKSRLGPRIQATVEDALSRAVRQGTIEQKGDFLWPAGLQMPPLRYRGELPAASRKFDLVSPEELALAVERVVVDAFGMEPDAIPVAAGRLIGFSRLSEENRKRLEEVISQLRDSKRLVLQGNHLIVPDLKVAG